MRKLMTIVGVAATGLTLIAAPGLAQAHRYHHGYYRHSGYNYGCHARQRHDANTGTVLGAIGGGLIGNSVSGHGSKFGGTLIGAGVGAVAGHQIAKHNSPC
jgi:hypothetical protein